MTYTITLTLEFDALNIEDAREQSREIAEDVMCWPAVISIEGSKVEET